jgi:hypothetical protein
VIHILQVNQQGDLNVPAEVLGKVPVNRRYLLEVQGEVLILRPEAPSERAAQWRKWATEHQANSPGLPDEALSRDNIYD